MLAHAKQRTNRRFRNKRVRNGATSIAMHLVYDSFGKLVSQTDPSASLGVAAVDCLFGYTGKAFDRATGLQNNLNRWYDPSVGTWLSEDPAAADENLYRYAGNGPTDGTDPSGLAETSGKKAEYNGQFWWYTDGSGGGTGMPPESDDYIIIPGQGLLHCAPCSPESPPLEQPAHAPNGIPLSGPALSAPSNVGLDKGAALPIEAYEALEKKFYPHASPAAQAPTPASPAAQAPAQPATLSNIEVKTGRANGGGLGWGHPVWPAVRDSGAAGSYDVSAASGKVSVTSDVQIWGNASQTRFGKAIGAGGEGMCNTAIPAIPFINGGEFDVYLKNQPAGVYEVQLSYTSVLVNTAKTGGPNLTFEFSPNTITTKTSVTTPDKIEAGGTVLTMRMPNHLVPSSKSNTLIVTVTVPLEKAAAGEPVRILKYIPTMSITSKRASFESYVTGNHRTHHPERAPRLRGRGHGI